MIARKILNLIFIKKSTKFTVIKIIDKKCLSKSGRKFNENYFIHFITYSLYYSMVSVMTHSFIILMDILIIEMTELREIIKYFVVIKELVLSNVKAS